MSSLLKEKSIDLLNLESFNSSVFLSKVILKIVGYIFAFEDFKLSLILKAEISLKLFI